MDGLQSEGEGRVKVISGVGDWREREENREGRSRLIIGLYIHNLPIATCTL